MVHLCYKSGISRHLEPIKEFMNLISTTNEQEMRKHKRDIVSLNSTNYDVSFFNTSLYRTLLTIKRGYDLMSNDNKIWFKVSENVVIICKLFDLDLIEHSEKISNLFFQYPDNINIIFNNKYPNSKEYYAKNIVPISVSCITRCFDNAFKLFPQLFADLWNLYYFSYKPLNQNYKKALEEWMDKHIKNQVKKEKLRKTDFFFTCATNSRLCIFCLKKLSKLKDESLTSQTSSIKLNDPCVCFYCLECQEELHSKLNKCLKCNKVFNLIEIKEHIERSSLNSHSSNVDNSFQMKKIIDMLNKILPKPISMHQLIFNDKKVYSRSRPIPIDLMNDLNVMLVKLLELENELIPNLSQLYIASCIWRLNMVLFNYSNINMVEYMEEFYMEDTLEIAPPVTVKSIQNLNYLASCIICDYIPKVTNYREDLSNYTLSSLESIGTLKFCHHKICIRCINFNRTTTPCPLECGTFSICINCLRYFLQGIQDKSSKPRGLYGICSKCRAAILIEYSLFVSISPKYFCSLFVTECQEFYNYFYYFIKEIKSSKYTKHVRSHYLSIKLLLNKMPKITPIEVLTMIKSSKKRNWLNRKLIGLHRIEKLARIFLGYLRYTADNMEIVNKNGQLSNIVLDELLSINDWGYDDIIHFIQFSFKFFLVIILFSLMYYSVYALRRLYK